MLCTWYYAIIIKSLNKLILYYMVLKETDLEIGTGNEFHPSLFVSKYRRVVIINTFIKIVI